MAAQIATRWLAIFFLGIPTALLCQQSGTTAPPSKPPSTANDNSFPEAQSAAAAAPKTPPSKPSSTANDNPFPEAQSAAAAKRDNLGATPSVSQQPLHLLPPPGVSSSNAEMPAKDLGETTIIKRHGREDEFTRDLNPAGRIKDDLRVADFYMKDWNYRGAYLRYKDVLQFNSLDETALFGVAQADCMQDKTAEALTQYKAYLQLYPDGKHSKEALKMLRNPKKCAKKN